MDKELKEEIAQEIATIGDEKLDISYSEKKTAQRILALIRSAGYVQRWKECPLCKGTGKQGAIENGYTSEWKCPTCTAQVKS